MLIFVKGKRIGIEIKFADAPAATRSMHIAVDNLKIERLYVVHPGKERYPLTDKIEVIPLEELLETLESESPKQ